ncbi:MAG: hypothetical protein HFH62_14605, partial [Lachnospiraceae bacterium]|nr:hypothetical protein [Lachnospiraceae bacterium]
ITVGKKLTLKVKKKNVKSAKVTWKSSKKAVASVSKKGVVKAKKAGKAKITATIKYKAKGSKKTKKKTLKCTVTVTKKTVLASKVPAPTKAPDVTKNPGGEATAVPTQTPGENATTAPTNTPGGDATSVPTNTPGGDATTAPTNTPGGDATTAPTNTPGGDATTAPTNTPGGDATTAPTDAPGGDATAAPTATPTYDKSFTGTYKLSLTTESEAQEATMTKYEAVGTADERIANAISDEYENDGKKQAALVVDVSKLNVTGMTKPMLKIDIPDNWCNIMQKESSSWTYIKTTNGYTTDITGMTSGAFAVYVGDKKDKTEITVAVSVVDEAYLPKLNVTNKVTEVSLTKGAVTEVDAPITMPLETQKAAFDGWAYIGGSSGPTAIETIKCDYDAESGKFKITTDASCDVTPSENTKIYLGIKCTLSDGSEYKLEYGDVVISAISDAS